MTRGDIRIQRYPAVKGDDTCAECHRPLYMEIPSAVELHDMRYAEELGGPALLGRACCVPHAERLALRLCNATLAVR